MREYVKNIATNEYRWSKKSEIKLPITEMLRKLGRVSVEAAYLPIKIVEEISKRRGK